MSGDEEVVLIPEEVKKKEVKPRMCAISRDGVSLFGFHLSWVVIVLVAVLVLVYLNKTGMLGDSINDILGSSSESSSYPSIGPSVRPSTTVPKTRMSGGGFNFKSFNVPCKGEMRMREGL